MARLLTRRFRVARATPAAATAMPAQAAGGMASPIRAQAMRAAKQQGDGEQRVGDHQIGQRVGFALVLPLALSVERMNVNWTAEFAVAAAFSHAGAAAP